MRIYVNRFMCKMLYKYPLLNIVTLTVAAIRTCQQEHGVTVDELAGKRTVAALVGE